MQNYIEFNKQIGETPLEALNRFKYENPEFKNSKLAYAGRLDPMAFGKMLILVDDECKNRDKYQGLDKEYEFEIIFGFSTDTGDVLGKVQNYEFEFSINDIEKTIKTFEKTYEQEYPVFSSKTIDGKPLWILAKSNLLNEITIPTKQVTVYKIDILTSRSVKLKNFISEFIGVIPQIKGSFRQEEIVEQWETFAQDFGEKKLFLVKCRAKVSSGTYIRKLAEDIGKSIQLPALAYNINRTKFYL